MLQRIQTVYLLIVAILYVVALFFPYASFFTPEGVEYAFSFKGLSPVDQPAWHWDFNTAWFSLIMAVIPALSLVTVNLYKKRMLQIRLSVFNIILMLGSYGLFFITKTMMGHSIEIETLSYHWTLIVPAVSAILTYLAIRAIGKDEVLVRSLDRIR